MRQDRHKYDYVVDGTSDHVATHILRMVGAHKRVLEVGCGPGSITRLLSGKGQCRVTGLDVDPEAIRNVAPACELAIQADLESDDWPKVLAGRDAFDVVVAADVLEHLYDPWTALRRMATLIGPDGYLVISLPHAGHAAVLGCLFAGDFAYREYGLLDRTHIRFFCLKNIEDLLARADLKILEAGYILRLPEDSEFAVQWAALPATFKAALGESAHAHVYQVVVKAVPLQRAGQSIRLLPPPRLTVGKGRSSIYSRWRARLAANLSPQFKQRVRALRAWVSNRR